MSSPLQVGITGGIGAGKSTICKIFEKLGVPVYYADDRAKYLMNQDTELKNELLKLFGEETYLPNGELNRSFLAKRVFGSSNEVEKLNGVVHPAVRKDYASWVQDYQGVPYFLREAALLIESGIYRDLDVLVTVVADEERRINRVLKRDKHRDRKQVEGIISKQVSEAERQEKSDFIIKNNDSRLVIPQVLEIHKALLKKAGSQEA